MKLKNLTVRIYKRWVYSKDRDKFAKSQGFSRDILRKITPVFERNDVVRCRFCHEVVSEDNFDRTVNYWYPHSWYPCHKGCKKRGEQEVAWWCQCLDADCNDCKHFQRDGVASHSGDVWNGYCKKFDTKVKAYPGTSTGHDCFEHRKQLDNLKFVKKP